MLKLYRQPRYYDIAFTHDRDIERETAFIRACFTRHARIPVSTVLEAACGSGMFLVGFPRYGYRITGYDISEEMVEYAREAILHHGVHDKAEAVVGDMRTIRFDRMFDAALTLISSLSYCLSDEDLHAHFQNMAMTVRHGGVYIVEIFFACSDLAYEKLPCESWTVERENLRIDVSWMLDRYDLKRKTRHINLNMDVQDNGMRFAIREAHCLRLWFQDDFREFCRIGGFRIDGVYDQAFRPIPLQTPLTGELGALYLVLVKE